MTDSVPDLHDLNHWSDDPRYIVDLVQRIVTVSVETVRIVDGFPPLRVLGGPGTE